MILTQSYKCH